MDGPSAGREGVPPVRLEHQKLTPPQPFPAVQGRAQSGVLALQGREQGGALAI